MAKQYIILIERNDSKQFSKFIGLFKERPEIPINEIRTKIAKSTLYKLVLNKLYTINESIKVIKPNIDSFISPALGHHNGRVVQTLKKNCNIEIMDSDPNFFYLRLNEGRKAKC